MSDNETNYEIPAFELDYGNDTTLRLVADLTGDFLPMFGDVPDGTSEEEARYSYVTNLWQVIAAIVVGEHRAEGSGDEAADGATETEGGAA